MKEQVKEMREMEARIKMFTKLAEKDRKAGDTASAAATERSLVGMRESRRALQASLENSARDCSPTMRDPEPARDPVRREALPKP